MPLNRLIVREPVFQRFMRPSSCRSILLNNFTSSAACEFGGGAYRVRQHSRRAVGTHARPDSALIRKICMQPEKPLLARAFCAVTVMMWCTLALRWGPVVSLSPNRRHNRKS
jgi:hypothetical protein